MSDQVRLPDGTPPLAEGIVSSISGIADGIKTVNVTNSDEVKAVLDEMNNQPHPAEKLPPVKVQPPVPIESLPANIQQEMLSLLDSSAAALKDNAPPPEKPPEPKTKIESCPNCGWDLKKADTLEVTDVDKQMWVRSILGLTRFTKEYVLYGNQVIVTLRTRRTAEQNMIVDKLSADRHAGKLTVESMPYWMSNYALCVSLQSVKFGDRTVEFPELVNGDNVLHASAETWFKKTLPDAWPDALTSSLIYALTHFDVFTSRMQFMARDNDFFLPPIGDR